MPHALAQSIEILTTILAVAGMGYFLAALIAARLFLNARRAPLPAFAPGVSILKSLKGLDPGIIDAFRSHCSQSYSGDYELLFGVSTLSDPAVAAVAQLQAEFPDRSIHLIECPLRLGTNGKVSTLVLLAAHARYNFLLINDSDITVSPRYLERVMACFGPDATPSGTQQAAKKLNPVGDVRSEGDVNPEGGGGFNPRIKPPKSMRALAPEGHFQSISLETSSFSAASLVVP